VDLRLKGIPKNQAYEDSKAANKGNQNLEKTLVKGKFFHFLDLKNLLEIKNDRDFIIGLTEIKGGILQKINNTSIEREMPNMMLSFLERLLK
jgi:hypothetical protein